MVEWKQKILVWDNPVEEIEVIDTVDLEFDIDKEISFFPELQDKIEKLEEERDCDFITVPMMFIDSSDRKVRVVLDLVDKVD